MTNENQRTQADIDRASLRAIELRDIRSFENHMSAAAADVSDFQKISNPDYQRFAAVQISENIQAHPEYRIYFESQAIYHPDLAGRVGELNVLNNAMSAAKDARKAAEMQSMMQGAQPGLQQHQEERLVPSFRPPTEAERMTGDAVVKADVAVALPLNLNESMSRFAYFQIKTPNVKDARFVRMERDRVDAEWKEMCQEEGRSVAFNIFDKTTSSESAEYSGVLLQRLRRIPESAAKDIEKAWTNPIATQVAKQPIEPDPAPRLRPERVMATTGLHVGPIVAIEDGRIAQKIGRDPDKVVWHDLTTLKGPTPTIGRMAEIEYSKGVGTVFQNALVPGVGR